MKSLYELKARMVTVSNLIASRRTELAELEEEKRIILICIRIAREEMERGGILNKNDIEIDS